MIKRTKVVSFSVCKVVFEKDGQLELHNDFKAYGNTTSELRRYVESVTGGDILKLEVISSGQETRIYDLLMLLANSEKA